jgi:hypothetical protein
MIDSISGNYPVNPVDPVKKSYIKKYERIAVLYLLKAADFLDHLMSSWSTLLGEWRFL